uniref:MITOCHONDRIAL UBIQUINOL-CYTOCHROME-C REDUCTASE COMPLEX CORE BC1, MEMBRANE PROTEIN, HEME n=1 Tax=Peduovirinae sp. ctGB41 TaxID=2825070 RepID=A0A8S5QDP2_9CAUD|nr:MAG TPA: MITOCHONDRIAL UBIQUINOL-CYTOCHROME-C REDUCTASE COMPLEX CORE BC1, MEMBRANE PROTEIN, HEME [Peduovirinae sp. ctGB41]
MYISDLISLQNKPNNLQPIFGKLAYQTSCFPYKISPYDQNMIRY